MEQFCKALHPDLEVGQVCIDWLHQAIEHCTAVMNNAKTPTASFWSTVKNFIFPDRTTTTITQKVSINNQPHHLALHDCQFIFLDIVNDYLQRAPRYAAESVANNSMMWQVFHSLIGVTALFASLLVAAYIYCKYCPPKININYIEEFRKPHKRMQAIAAKSLRLAKTELRNFKIKPQTRKEEIVPADGSAVLVLKVGAKYDFVESIVQGCLQSVGKFHRLYDQHNKTKSNFHLEPINKALQFLNNNGQKLHLLLMFEEDRDFEQEKEAAKKLLKTSARIKSVVPPLSPRFKTSTSTANQIFNNRLEGGNSLQKSDKKETSTSDNNSRASTPNRHTTPRSTFTPRSGSGIPLKAPLSARKTN